VWEPFLALKRVCEVREFPAVTAGHGNSWALVLPMGRVTAESYLDDGGFYREGVKRPMDSPVGVYNSSVSKEIK